MKQSFAGKSVWITGASSGIGRALAIAFHKEGANLILSSRNVNGLVETQRQCSGIGNIDVVPMDLTDASAIEMNVREILKRYDRIDLLIHNAGIAAKDIAINTEVEIDKLVMETNYWGPVSLTKALLPSMIESRCGQIVVVSSLAGKYGVPTLSGYSASKHALHGFFDSLRTEIHQHNVRVTMLVLGFVDTEITMKALTGDGRRYEKKPTAHRQGITAERCAAQMLAAIKSGKEEVIIGGLETVTVLLHRLFPAISSRLMRNHPVKLMQRVKKISRLRLTQ